MEQQAEDREKEEAFERALRLLLEDPQSLGMTLGEWTAEMAKDETPKEGRRQRKEV